MYVLGHGIDIFDSGAVESCEQYSNFRPETKIFESDVVVVGSCNDTNIYAVISLRVLLLLLTTEIILTCDLYIDSSPETEISDSVVAAVGSSTDIVQLSNIPVPEPENLESYVAAVDSYKDNVCYIC